MKILVRKLLVVGVYNHWPTSIIIHSTPSFILLSLVSRVLTVGTCIHHFAPYNIVCKKSIMNYQICSLDDPSCSCYIISKQCP